MYARNVSRIRLLLYGRDHMRVCSPPYARLFASTGQTHQTFHKFSPLKMPPIYLIFMLLYLLMS